jgi:hypothetical protein
MSKSATNLIARRSTQKGAFFLRVEVFDPLVEEDAVDVDVRITVSRLTTHFYGDRGTAAAVHPVFRSVTPSIGAGRLYDDHQSDAAGADAHRKLVGDCEDSHRPAKEFESITTKAPGIKAWRLCFFNRRSLRANAQLG